MVTVACCCNRREMVACCCNRMVRMGSRMGLAYCCCNRMAMAGIRNRMGLAYYCCRIHIRRDSTHSRMVRMGNRMDSLVLSMDMSCYIRSRIGWGCRSRMGYYSHSQVLQVLQALLHHIHTGNRMSGKHDLQSSCDVYARTIARCLPLLRSDRICISSSIIPLLHTSYLA
jgi:hypothetical protein